MQDQNEKLATDGQKQFHQISLSGIVTNLHEKNKYVWMNILTFRIHLCIAENKAKSSNNANNIWT